MFQVLIIPAKSAANISLFFRTQEKAEIAFNNIYDIIKGAKAIETIRQTDEFGVTVAVGKDDIAYAALIDMTIQSTLQAALRPATSTIPAAQEAPAIITEAN